MKTDLRDASTTPLNFTKSINLALSERGINAMRHSGSSTLLDSVLADTIPMHGRMIHGKDRSGAFTEESQQYDIHGNYLRAVDRAILNKVLLNELEGLPNVKLIFHSKLTGADFRKRKAWFETTPAKAPQTADGAQIAQPQHDDRPKEREISFDLLLGCDGAHSSVRYHLMKSLRMDYQQSYIDTLWCEFTIPAASDTTTPSPSPSATSGFATSPNHLHIWPSATSMFIAIPSVDKTFTCTLFAPSQTFSTLEASPSDLTTYFTETFPGALPLIGSSESLEKQFKANPHLPLISIKCSPHTFSSSAAILGDAAHAMVPFYGQGMNAGLEDVHVLFTHLDAQISSESGREAALAEYTTTRVPDAHTINDLASANYWEMHAGVTSPVYLARKNVEEFLSDKVPASGFKTQYSRVSFSNERYSEVAAAVSRQGKMLLQALVGTVALPVLGWAAWWAWRWQRATPVARDAFRGSLDFTALTERVGRIFT
nr:hypothetical protein B0A51_12327 [Rachicladosporium sp. CCFEE 5018]